MQHDNYKIRASVSWETLNKLPCSINIQLRLIPYAKIETLFVYNFTFNFYKPLDYTYTEMF